MVLGIYGSGKLGREVLELAKIINERKNSWEKIIFIGGVDPVVNGVKVYTYEEACNEFGEDLEITIGVGEPAGREKLFKELVRDGAKLTTLIHPDVHVPDTTTIGKGVIIQAGCFISCNSTICDAVLIQPMVAIGHDNVINEGCVLSTMVCVAGNVELGKYTYVGLSSAIKEEVKIGNYTIIGMYSAVYKDVPDEMIAMGNPARPMKKNEEHKVFD